MRPDALRLSPFGGARVPMLLQSEAAECALACLAMVVAAHGHRTDLPTLRQRFSLSLKGATMADLVRMAGELRFNARALRLEPEQLQQLAVPCVLHWDLNHFVVLTEVRGTTVTVHDPARGVRRLRLHEVGEHFTGVALELAPAADFSPRVERQSVGLRRMIGPVRGLKRSLAQILLLAVGLEVFVLGSPLLLQWVVDDVVVGNDRDLLLTLGIGFSLLVLLQVVTAALRSWAVLHLSATLNLQWLGNVFAHLMRLPVAWFEKRHAGDVWSRFSAVQQIQKTLSTHFVEALIDGLLVVATLAMMAFYSVTLSAIALAAVAAYALLRWAVLAAPEDMGVPRLSGTAPQARIEVRGVSFRYADNDADVLQGVSLAIEPGESVAIVGPSGGGKTTLLKLLLGIHAPQAGEIRIGGLPLQQLGLAQWRSMVGTVMQDDALLTGSVIDNISFFDAAPDLDWVMECARVAAVHDDIEAMPMGYHTLIGEMGSSLSGGQRQRLLLARALYKRPQVLLLDEATSALDVERERVVNQNIRKLALTRVIVAHRPETIASAARVVVLHEGRVTQDLRSVPGAGRGT